MKRFCKFNLLFALPVLVCLAVIEILVHQIPNSYSYKYNFVINHGDKIEAIAIGHSQMYDDFNPAVFKLPAFNLSNSAQSYIDDYYIMKRLLPSMPNLKVVILPIGYIDADNIETRGLSERSVYYHEYMDICYDGALSLSNRLECFNPKSAISKIVSFYLKKQDITRCDSLGQRNTSLLKLREKELGEEKLIEGYTKEYEDGFHILNEEYLERIVKLLSGHDIQIVLVSPPYYWQCAQIVNKKQKIFVHEYAHRFSKEHGIQYIDMEDCNLFEYDDFFDESHLTEHGAEKFTNILNELISL